MITNNLANKILDAICGRTVNISMGGSAYLALSTTAPNKNGTGVTEPTGNGYSRKLIGMSTQSATIQMGAAANGMITNNQEIHFNEATGSWGTCTYACIYSAANGGELLAYGQLMNEAGTAAEPINPVTNTVVIIKTGKLKISME